MGWTLTNKHINIMLRLRLFDTVATPALLYSLDTCALTHGDLARVDIVQRKMLRCMIGWVTHPDDTWEEAGRRMARRLSSALELFPIPKR